MWRQCAFGVVLGVFVGLGIAAQVDVSFQPHGTGFFLKPMFRGQEVFSLNSLERPLVVTNPVGPVTVKAKYGPFTQEQNVPLSLLQARVGNHSNTLSSLVTQDVDISAHLVSHTVTQERPTVSVLFHASQLPHNEQNQIKSTKSPSSATDWCVQMHVKRKDQQLTSVCVLSVTDNICIADLTIPSDWWDSKQTTTAQVYYSLYLLDTTKECSNQAFSADINQPSDTSSKSITMFVSSVTLTHGHVTYQELKEDQHILVYIPQKNFYPGSTFSVPVKLQAESDLQIFVIKVKARHGMRIVGAIPSDGTKWHITTDLNHKSKAAMVTASVTDPKTYSKTDRIQTIFEFVFEVEEGASGEPRGRLSFTLAYEMNNQLREQYGSVENHVVAKIDIQQDHTRAIVPVIKNTDLVNVAMLTGKMVSLPMKIYSISQGGKVADITSTTTCHSGDEQVLKVAQSCNLVYLDGTETKGSASVSVIAKYGRHNEFLFFRVWVPEFPLELQLSDDKLSQIKGWKVAVDQSTTSRKTRGVDFGLLTDPDLLFHEEGMRKEDLDTTCQLRFQQTEVEVYARFVLGDGDKKQHLVHRKALFRLTEDMMDRLRIADVSVAKLTENIVQGLKPGRTEIQVVTRLGRVIGAHELRVGKGKVEIEKLEVDVVTDIEMSLDVEPQMDGVLKANIHRNTQFSKAYQEGILDIRLWFDDGTSTQLHQVPTSDYVLEADTLNNHVVAFGPQLSPDMPRVIALGPGKGKLLKISLELGDSCQRKKSRNLAFGYVYINIAFSDKNLQADSGHYKYNNRVSERYGSQQPHEDPGKIFFSVDDHKELTKPKSVPKTGGVESIPIDEWDFVDKENMNPSHEAHQQLVLKAQGMTPLEIGMYVLLAIFCLAIVVFMVNCMIFVARYKRKRKPKETKESMSNVNDWVWIGRATLERNAINTTCSQALMSDADFNGNHNLQCLVPPDNSNSRGRNSAAESSNSNRNSVISTYKGSECSIRITTNPLSNEAGHTEDVIEEVTTSQAASSPTNTSCTGATSHVNSHEDLHTDSHEELARPYGKDSDSISDHYDKVDSHIMTQSLPGARASCPAAIGPHPGLFSLSSDSEDQCSLGRDYFKSREEPKAGPSKAGPSEAGPSKSGPSDQSKEDSDDKDLGLGACGSDEETLLRRRQRREAFQVALAESIKAQQDSANGNIANGNISEAEWDYEVMGLTYEQLMDYFDNLKESTA